MRAGNIIFYNDIQTNEDTTKNIVEVQLNRVSILDDGDGVVKFSKPLPITSNKEQFNGTRYDIDSMDISSYKGLITIDHSDSVKDIVGKVTGLAKDKSKVVIDGIKFAIEQSALARFAKDMLLAGFVTDFSIETIGPFPDEEGVYYNSQLVGLSMVIVGNNQLATVSTVAEKVLNTAKNDGLETNDLENYLKEDLGIDKQISSGHNENMKYVTVKNTRDFAVSVSYKNAADEDTKLTLDPGESVDVPEELVEDVETQIKKVEPPKKDIKDTKDATGADGQGDTDTKDGAGDAAASIAKALSPIMEKMEKLEKTIFDNSAKEPEFRKISVVKTENALKDMDYRERAGMQINYAWEYLKGGNQESGRKLSSINEFHINELKKSGKVNNAVTVSDFGNFVISPELLRDIEGHRSNFTPFLSRLDWRETLALQMSFLKRDGDIDMEEVENCDDGADGNLKPISEYEATIQTKDLHELAAVTPVCNAATRFLAVDLLGDVTAGYRTDYDRKRAQLVVARLQQAVNSTGEKVSYDKTSSSTALASWIQTWIEVQEEIMGGLFIFNQKTYGQLLMEAISAGISGPLAGLFTTGDQPLIAGTPYVVVPNELLPSLNSGETKSFTVEGEVVTIDQAVFYFDPSTFTGRTSGGLNFDLSTEAAYEDNGTVKSAFQRNELVLRGSFFRNGAIKDEDKVASMFAAGVS